MSQETQIIKKECDVLICGGGIAGALAAIEAAKLNADVIVLERADTYRSGCAGSGIDHLTSYVPPFHEAIGYTREMMKEEMAGGWIGRGLGDRRITDHFVDVSYERIIGLEEYGLKLRGFEDSHLPEGFRMVPQFQNVPTSINFEGRDLKVKLTEEMKKKNVDIINHAQVVKILTGANGDAVGAVAVSSREDLIFEIHAKAVVISVNSGAGQLAYPCNKEDRHYENPTASKSGAGITLPLSAGADVANLEFSLAEGELSYMGFSTRVGSPGSSWWPAARAIDDDGTVFVKRIYDLPVDTPDYIEKHTQMWKEFMDSFYAMHGAIVNGRALYMDLQEASEKEVDYIRWTLGHEGRCWLWIQNLDRAGIDLKDVKLPYKFEKKVSMHGVCSGVVVNEKTETTVRGLYAAGDTMGLGAGSGPFAVVYGIEAGLQAAAYARNLDERIEPLDDQTVQVKELVEKIKANESGEPWQNVEAAARGVVNTFGTSPITDTRVRYALEKIRQLRDDPNLYASNPHEMARAFQVLSLIDAAEAIFEAADHRQEGVGPYKRVRKYADWEKYGDRKEPEHIVSYAIYKKDGRFGFREYDYSDPAKRIG